ncbi:hypothetical protein M0R36_08080 [bacterium]|jgi:hypothetical protein|nr:hypothetical protein [bacterium]
MEYPAVGYEPELAQDNKDIVAFIYYGKLLQFNKIAKPSKEEIKEASERIMREVEALKEGAS